MTSLTRIAAVGLVILAVLLAAYAWLLSQRPAALPSETLVSTAPAAERVASYRVVVASQALTAGQTLEASALNVVELPINPEGAFATVEPLLGQVMKVDVGAGTPLAESFLSKSLSLQLKENERAVGIAVDEVLGVGNRVLPGDLVDVFFMLKKSQEIQVTQTRLLLSRVRVLAYGADSVEGRSGNAAGRTGQDAPSRSAVLAVPLEAVNGLLLASQSGRLQLAGRHPEDLQAPQASLFVQPDTVLPTRPTLTALERDALQRPENRAFAGEALPGFAGQPTSSTARTPAAASRGASAPRRAPTPVVEVMRGTQSEKVNF